MGTDKALLVVGGTTLLERTIGEVGSIADDVFIVGFRPQYADCGVAVIADAYPGAGTLGGIATALRHAVNERVIVVGCDMPLLSAQLLAAIAAVDPSADVTVPVRGCAHRRQGTAHTFETLHAVYNRRCLEPIERRLIAGDYRVFAFFEDVRVRSLDESWLRRIDPTLESMTNTNTPEEFQRVIARVGAGLIDQEDEVG